MTVLTLVDFVVAGGGERVAVDLAVGAGKRHRAVFCASRSGQDVRADPAAQATVEELEASDVRYVGLGRSATWKVWQWWPLVKFLRDEKVDVLHAHKRGSNFWGTVLGRLAGVPLLVAHEHTAVEDARRIARFVNRHVVARLADVIIVPSDWTRRTLTEGGGIPDAKIVIVPNGTSLADEMHDRTGTRALVGVPENAEVVLSVGMLRPEKAHDVFVEAIAILARDRPRVVGLIAGGPDSMQARNVRGELESQIRRLGISERVRLLGRRRDVQVLLATADVAVSSSERENLPKAVIEYMKSGTPIVATGVGGVPELLDDGVHGLIVPPRDAKAMAFAIGRLLDDRRLADCVSSAARGRWRSALTLEAITDRVNQIYLAGSPT